MAGQHAPEICLSLPFQGWDDTTTAGFLMGSRDSRSSLGSGPPTCQADTLPTKLFLQHVTLDLLTKILFEPGNKQLLYIIYGYVFVLQQQNEVGNKITELAEAETSPILSCTDKDLLGFDFISFKPILHRCTTDS